MPEKHDIQTTNKFDDAVDAAAHVLFERDGSHIPYWGDCDESQQTWYRDTAREALLVAVPHLFRGGV